MPATGHEALLRSFYAALDQHDWDTALSMVTDDVCWHIAPNDTVREGTFAGRSELAEWFTTGLSTHRTRQTLTRTVEEGEFAVAFVVAEYGFSNRVVVSSAVDVYLFAGGLISERTRVLAPAHQPETRIGPGSSS